MTAPPTITPVFVADLSVEGEWMPVYVHVIDHPAARVLVDTGMTELHPAMADMDPRLQPLNVNRPSGEEVVAAAVVGVQVCVDDDVDAGEVEVLRVQWKEAGIEVGRR